MRVNTAGKYHYSVVHLSRNSFAEVHLVERERDVLASSANDVIEKLFLDEIFVGRS